MDALPSWPPVYCPEMSWTLGRTAGRETLEWVWLKLHAQNKDQLDLLKLSLVSGKRGHYLSPSLGSPDPSRVKWWTAKPGRASEKVLQMYHMNWDEASWLSPAVIQPKQVAEQCLPFSLPCIRWDITNVIHLGWMSLYQLAQHASESL